MSTLWNAAYYREGITHYTKTVMAAYSNRDYYVNLLEILFLLGYREFFCNLWFSLKIYDFLWPSCEHLNLHGYSWIPEEAINIIKFALDVIRKGLISLVRMWFCRNVDMISHLCTPYVCILSSLQWPRFYQGYWWVSSCDLPLQLIDDSHDSHHCACIYWSEIHLRPRICCLPRPIEKFHKGAAGPPLGAATRRPIHFLG